MAGNEKGIVEIGKVWGGLWVVKVKFGVVFGVDFVGYDVDDWIIMMMIVLYSWL